MMLIGLRSGTFFLIDSFLTPSKIFMKITQVHTLCCIFVTFFICRDVFDEKWFVTCKSFNCILDRLVNRHLQTWTEEKTRMFGEGAIGAKKKAESNDLLNAQFIIDCTMKYADMVIESE